MNEMQITLISDGTPEQAQAMGLHYEIIAAAQAAANSLLDLGRKLKRMRDTGGYKRLGFETFAQYTEQAVGIRQRQAYNYITVVENVPARLVEENAAAGVTKLALLAKLGPADQQEVAGELADITVKELQSLIEEKNGLAEQLSMMQSEAPVEGRAEEVDMEALRAEVREQERAVLEVVYQKKLESQRRQLEKENLEQREARIREIAKDQQDAMEERIKAYREETDREAAEKVKKAKADAARKAEEDIAAARRDAAEEARRQQEEKDREALEQARKEAEEARARAEATARQLDLAASEDSVRFALLFEQLQDAAQKMLDLIDAMNADGRTEEAERLHTALSGALQALAGEVGITDSEGYNA